MEKRRTDSTPKNRLKTETRDEKRRREGETERERRVVLGSFSIFSVDSSQSFEENRSVDVHQEKNVHTLSRRQTRSRPFAVKDETRVGMELGVNDDQSRAC